MVENYDPLGALAYWRRGDLSPRSWLASLGGISEAAWFARDDLRPFGLMCARMGWRLMAGHRAPAPRPGQRFAPGRAAIPPFSRNAASTNASITEEARA